MSTTCDEQISLILYYPGKWVITVHMNPSSTIGSLKSLVKENDVLFIHDGEYLIESFPASFYNIKDGETLVIVSSKEYDPSQNKWHQITRDKESFNEKINSVLNPVTSDQAARIRDLQMLRIEKKSKMFYKLINSTLKENDTMYTNTKIPMNLQIPTKPLTVSKDPLPLFWNTKPQTKCVSSKCQPLPSSYIPRDVTINVQEKC